MTELIPWTRPRGAVHDLQHLFSLSDDRCIILCLTERELYVLQNWMALDVEFEIRYAKTIQYNGYEPLTKDDELWTSWLAFVRGFQIGVRDMTCNLQAGLESIAGAIQSLADRPCGGGTGSLPGVVGNLAPCLSGLPDDNYVPQAPLSPPQGQPPEGFDTWEEYLAYKCNAANWLWRWQRGNIQYFRDLDAGVTAVVVLVPILALIFATVEAPPVSAIAAIIGVAIEVAILTGSGWWFLDQMLAKWDADREDIVCALYSSGSSTEAAEAMLNRSQDAIQAIVSWGVLEPLAPQIAELLGELFGQMIGNNAVKPLFVATAAVQGSQDPGQIDCDECTGPLAWDFEDGFEGFVYESYPTWDDDNETFDLVGDVTGDALRLLTSILDDVPRGASARKSNLNVPVASGMSISVSHKVSGDESTSSFLVIFSDETSVAIWTSGIHGPHEWEIHTLDLTPYAGKTIVEFWWIEGNSKPGAVDTRIDDIEISL